MPIARDQRRRHSRQNPPPKSLAPPSTVSVLSSSTSGSNSTVTPGRALRSGQRSAKHHESRKARVKEPTPAEEIGKAPTLARLDQENDVFQYMDVDENSEGKGSPTEEAVEENHRDGDNDDDDDNDNDSDDDDDEASTTSTAPLVGRPSPQTPDSQAVEALKVNPREQHAWHKEKSHEASLHSDSGISVRSSSPEQESPVLQQKRPVIRSSAASGGKEKHGPFSSGYRSRTSSIDSSASRVSTYPKDWSTVYDQTAQPEEYYALSRPVVTQKAHPSKRQPSDSRRLQVDRLAPQAVQPPGPLPTPKKSGYDALASAIRSQPHDNLLKPIYRKFETLNNRILLYLQDEISELEADLSDLDKAITREEQVFCHTHASRRAEARFPSQLQWRRLDLLGRIYVKVEQYNRALTSYSNLTKSLGPASHADINFYRDWIAEHAPIAGPEAAFLQNEADLVALSSSEDAAAEPTQPLRQGGLETPFIAVALILVSTVIIFKVVPRLLARIVISAVVGLASLCALSPSALTNFNNIKDWRRGIGIYTAVMLVLAIVVS